MTLVGNDNFCDLSLPDMSLPSFSIECSETSVKLSYVGEDRKLSKLWNKSVSLWQSIEISGISFILLSDSLNLSTKEGTKLSNLFSNYEQLPRDFDRNYPHKLLSYLLEGINVSEGILFFKNEEEISILASKNIKLRDKAEFILKQFVEEADESFRYINFETHSLLFKANMDPKSFYLFKQDINDGECIIFYFPVPEKELIPTGVLQTILHLSVHSFRLYFAQQKKQSKKGLWNEGEFFWGENEKMVHLKTIVDKLAPTSLSLFIQGETGAGKELLSKYIAEKSSYGEMITLNCAAIPEELAESILFGHVKGAFTGATQDQIGVLEQADGKTLFLDEIGELSLPIQAKLLRAIQEKEIQIIGGKKKKVNFRLLTASHKNLQLACHEQTFREDLLFRISEANLIIPSLRERSEDLLTIAEGVLSHFIKRNHLTDLMFSHESLKWIKHYDWPGNFRELISTIRKASVLATGEFIEPHDLTGLSIVGDQQFEWDLKNAKAKFIEGHIKKALNECDGVRHDAAKLLGISERSLYRMMADIPNMSTDSFGRENTISHQL